MGFLTMKYKSKNMMSNKKTAIPQPIAFIPLLEASCPTKTAAINASVNQ
jgi:hypothetical protein